MAEIVQVWGKRLAEIRDKYNIKQADFAKMIGKGETHVSRWERGVSGKKGVPIDLRIAMADVFTTKEIKYIQTGNRPDEEDGCEEECPVDIVVEPSILYNNLPPEVVTVIDILKNMDKNKRMDVLHYALDINK